MVKFRALVVAVLLSAAPASLAVAAPGLVRTSVTMRAGPGAGFPIVDQIPAGARVIIYGCLQGGTWCDVSFERERGWVAATALAYLYGQRYVYLPEYVDEVPVVPFTLSVYWSSFYVGRPWYHRHVFWNRYWLRHPPVMAQNPPSPGMAPGAAVGGPGGGGQTAAGPGSIAGAGRRSVPVERVATGSLAPVAGHAGPQVSVGTPVQAVAPSQPMQPPTARMGGAAQSARAQMGGMQSFIASAPHAGAAPRFAPGPAMSGLRLGASSARSGAGGGFRRH